MRKKSWKKFIASLIAVVAIVVGWLIVEPQSASADQTYTFATNGTFAPFEMQDSKGGYSGKNPGIEIEMLQQIAKHEHFKYQFKSMSFNGDLQALEGGQVDAVMAGMSVTNERKQKYDFSKAYYTDGVMMAVAKNSKIKSLKQLRGKTVSAKSGTSAALFLKKNQKKYGYKIKYFDSSNTMWNDVKNGNAAATFDDGPVLQYGIRQGVDLKIVTKKPIDAQPVAIGFQKGQNKELQAKINDGITWMKKTGRMQKIINKYTKSKATTKNSTQAHTIMGLLKANKSALLSGLWMTLKLTIVGIIFAMIFGIILGVLGVVENKFANGLSSTLIYIFRGIPMIVLAFFIYMGLPNVIGHKVPLFLAGILTLTFDEGAYIGAIVKGGFESVNVGQWEAARSLGLPYSKALIKVIAPQGFKLMVPSLVNQFIITLKDTSILSAIGLMELTQTGTVIISQNMEGFRMWTIIAVIYIIIITLLTWLSNYVQKRMD
ncbi:ABC transporter substrate-binding protein/permease [Limosilactobacillus sp.]|jgi:polar amino acid transport system substrate-binding protein|uniref:ABC transporter substrate-binding protein/permease n=1 Tax=Limosilactobacillus sp. TaxID=2773925 RepID=UPI0025C07C02|nr:ABC transporter substrate-binding protein/permease [Limosilactobacillus sp.]MCH3921780.1 ABC transporter substrate-binding protein/permease [Limosilactobacillus sp.]MCH3928551.1 ABC transporter substrate-binding protein/permease [Limosilactobacillus sp.]